MGPSPERVPEERGVAGAVAVAGGSARSGSANARTQAGAAVLRSVETDVLEIGYEESGDPAGFPIVLLHGFPYDIRSWDRRRSTAGGGWLPGGSCPICAATARPASSIPRRRGWRSRPR